MFVIGLTGGIASGKSTVSEMLEAKGAAIVHADRIGHQVYEPGTPVWQEVVSAFGKEIVAADGRIDRQRLGQIVFSDPQARQRLNAITHPPIRALMAQRLAELRAEGTAVAVLEAALLIEAGWLDLTDEVWVTVVPPQVAAQRLIERNGLSPQEAWARIQSQISNQERLKHAQAIISTDCSLEEVRRQVDELWDGLTARLAAKAT